MQKFPVHFGKTRIYLTVTGSGAADWTELRPTGRDEVLAVEIVRDGAKPRDVLGRRVGLAERRQVVEVGVVHPRQGLLDEGLGVLEVADGGPGIRELFTGRGQIPIGRRDQFFRLGYSERGEQVGEDGSQ